VIDYQRMVALRHRALDLIPSLVVLMLAVVGPVTDVDDDQCQTSDGPQYACWLEHGRE